jgi:hypothetical protein
VVKLPNELLCQEKQARPNQNQSGICLPGTRPNPTS